MNRIPGGPVCRTTMKRKTLCTCLIKMGWGQNKCISGVKRWSCQISSASIYSDTNKGVLSHWQSYRNLKVIHLNRDCPSEHQEINDIINLFWSNVSFLISVPLLVTAYPWTFDHLTSFVLSLTSMDLAQKQLPTLSKGMDLLMGS